MNGHYTFDRPDAIRPIAFDGAKLKEHGSKVSSFGERGSYAVPRFNVDGILNLGTESYSQIFRDGRTESAMSAIVFQPKGHYGEADQKPSNQPRYLRDTICEQAVFKLTKDYLSFCTDIGLHPPIMMYSALVGTPKTARSVGLDEPAIFEPS